MKMEAKTISMLVLGFSLVIGSGLAVIAGLWHKSKNCGLLWLFPQLGFLILAFLKFLYLIQAKPEIADVMISEENTRSLGLIGVYWAMSMIFMLMGIFRLNRKQCKDNN
jgi:uncharacterized membrane protein YagU involved in acid resistance